MNFIQVIPVFAATENYEVIHNAAALVLLTLSGAFMYQLYAMQKKNLKVINKKAEIENKRLDNLTSILKSTSKAFNVGEQLKGAAELNLKTSQEISENLEQMERFMTGLISNVQLSYSANENISTNKIYLKFCDLKTIYCFRPCYILTGQYRQT